MEKTDTISIGEYGSYSSSDIVIEKIVIKQTSCFMFLSRIKNKLLRDILYTVVFAAGSISFWYDYIIDGRRMGLSGGILFGIIAIIKLIDVVQDYRNKKFIRQ
jgi:hypothetical protein